MSASLIQDPTFEDSTEVAHISNPASIASVDLATIQFIYDCSQRHSRLKAKAVKIKSTHHSLLYMGRATEQGMWWRMSSNLLLLASHGRRGRSVESALNLCFIWSHRQNINYLGAVQPTFTLNFSKDSKPFPPHNTFGRPGAKRVALYLGIPSRDDVYFHRILDHTDQGFDREVSRILAKSWGSSQVDFRILGPVMEGNVYPRARGFFVVIFDKVEDRNKIFCTSL
ncbi:hypothetical protein SUGI_0821720 [Cryptomeria japonica]|nr:hypothetical protein SUGI_0821720 [Cryptomeria japonica]